RRAASSFSAIVAAAQGRSRLSSDVGGAIVALACDTPTRLAILRASEVGIVTLDDAAYPERLRRIDLPPPVLLTRGDLTAWSAARTVAVVGTRRPTERGRLVAARIAAAIARAGGVVISGLAVGIDGAAHAAVVAEGRPTVAVLGSGHDRLYPRAHARLAAEIVATGGLVASEIFPDTSATKGTFPQRNRLISGLADATVVVEAGIRSGALITADWALGQGRDCFVVPGPVDEARSAGILDFYREFGDVVRLVTGIPELIADLGLGGAALGEITTANEPPPNVSVRALLIELGPTVHAVADALIAGHGSVDDLAAVTGHEPATILSAITLLEMRGFATSTYGRYRAAGRLAGESPNRRPGDPSSRPRYRSGAAIAKRRAAARLPGPSEPC
ncbi:MAG TPA: DNA-processing protein DprA, partial [Candidatus Limnocylindrales bacterium]